MRPARPPARSFLLGAVRIRATGPRVQVFLEVPIGNALEN